MLTLGPSDTLNAVAGTASAITCSIFGDDLSAGVDAFSTLYVGQLSNSISQLLAASGNQRLVKTIMLTNTTVSNVMGVQLFVNGTTDANRIINLTLLANGSAHFGQDGWAVYDANGTLQSGQQGPQGIPGPQGPPGAETVVKTANQAIGGDRVVKLISATEVDYASADTAGDAQILLGVTVGAAAAGAPITIRVNGTQTITGAVFGQGNPVFLGLNGLLVDVPDPASIFVAQIGSAILTDTVLIHTETPTYL